MFKRNPSPDLLSFLGARLGLAGASGPNTMALFASGDAGDSKRTVRAGRRRTSGSTEPGPRERAEAPKREKPSAAPGGPPRPPAAPPPMGPTGGAPMSGLPRNPLLAILGLAVVACLVLFTVLFGGGGGDMGELLPPVPEQEAQLPEQEPPTPVPQAPRPTPTPRPLTGGASPTRGDTWLILLYQDADDKILEQDIYIDLNEAERVGSSDKVHIVSQMDRYAGGFSGDGNWTGTRRYYVTQDPDLNRVRSELVEDLGELNMADGKTLVDFAVWAIETYPADKVVLIMSDHGMGWPGGWSDPAPPRRGNPQVPLSQVIGNQFYLHEIDAALAEIRQRTGLDKFELVGMDACLMGHLEVFEMLSDHARYAVASQETEPALGWAYTSFLRELQRNPGMSGAELGQLIVQSYIGEDQRIVDDQARAEFVGGGRGGMYGGPTAAQITAQLDRNITLAAVDLSQIGALREATNELAFALQGINQKIAAQARTYAQSFTSIFGSSVPPSYIDLGHFAQLAAQNSRDPKVASAADQVMQALGQFVVAERHGRNRAGATGVSIYFPSSQLYQNAAAGPQSYLVTSQRFADRSLWDEFLAFHYTGRRFDRGAAGVAVPARGEPIVGPGAGKISVSPLKLSSKVAEPGKPILMSADISGENIGYVRLFVGYLDRQSNSIYVADTDYLDSPETRELEGIYYPDWGEGDFTLEFEWEPIVFAITDGRRSVVALFNPEEYGRTREEAVYSVQGIYTYQDGEQRPALLYFQDGVMRAVYGFTGDEAGAPREIIPEPGDTFTVLEIWLDLDANGRVVSRDTQEGETLVFGDQPFTWKEMDAAPGNYVVGFIVEDLDGNSVAVYEQVTVR